MNQINKSTQNAPEFGLGGLKKYFKDDVLSGFLVFLVALPLCLGISMASGFPPIGGIFTAIIGGMLVPVIAGKKNAQLTIKGPAAGLIAIAIACVTDLGKGDPLIGYKLALAVVVATGVIQIIFGIFKLGNFSDFFPISVVHGMLSAIGIIIILKQFPTMLGVKPAAKDMMSLIAELPTTIANINYEIALIGFISLAILIILPRIKNKYVKMIPAPMVVILISIPLGMYFDLEHEHVYLFQQHQYHVGPNFLVTLPGKMADAISFPDFSQLFSGTSIKYIIMFALVGSLETLISAKAVDMLDPYKRKTNFNRDLIAVGAGNTLAGFIGGLPMISEIVRSSANINNGAKTSWSNFFHGAFLLIFVAFFPMLIHKIPLAALAAMLVFTGFRLASPKEFSKTFKIGAEQLFIFCVTIFFTLYEDLLVGIFAGIAAKFLVELVMGVKPKNIFKAEVDIEDQGDNRIVIKLHGSAVFSNWLGIKRKLLALEPGKHLQIDLSECKLVDHSAMDNLHMFEGNYRAAGGHCHIIGLDTHKPLSKHPLAVRVKPKVG